MSQGYETHQTNETPDRDPSRDAKLSSRVSRRPFATATSQVSMREGGIRSCIPSNILCPASIYRGLRDPDTQKPIMGRKTHFLTILPSHTDWYKTACERYNLKLETKPILHVCHEITCPLGPTSWTSAERRQSEVGAVDLPSTWEAGDRPVLTAETCIKLNNMSTDFFREAEGRGVMPSPEEMSLRSHKSRSRKNHRARCWTRAAETLMESEVGRRSSLRPQSDDAPIFGIWSMGQSLSYAPSNSKCLLCDHLLAETSGQLPDNIVSHDLSILNTKHPAYKTVLRDRYPTVPSTDEPVLLISTAPGCPARWDELQMPVQTVGVWNALNSKENSDLCPSGESGSCASLVPGELRRRWTRELSDMTREELDRV